MSESKTPLTFAAITEAEDCYHCLYPGMKRRPVHHDRMEALELAANALAAALRKSQWADSECDGYDQLYYCPECAGTELSGHHPTCSIAAALAEFDKLKP